MKSIEIYIQDLIPSKQDEIIEMLGENGNYDVFPLAVLEWEEDDEDNRDEEDFEMVK